MPLSLQDRSAWDHDEIAEGIATLDRALRLRRTGPYQVQAGIAAAHDVAASASATNWRTIVRLYEEHQRIAPSPVVTLNHAVAVGFADGPRAGLALLDPLLASGELDRYQPLWAALAELRAQPATARRRASPTSARSRSATTRSSATSCAAG